MTIRFTKMHGLGNDFMVVDAIHQSFSLTADDIAALSRRGTGVGFDQLLLIESSKKSGIDFFYRIFNADGQEVGQCGNGARCLARFIHHYDLTHKKEITVATSTTEMTLIINPDQSVTVNFGTPNLNPADIPLKAEKKQATYHITSDIEPVHAINVGNPHAVMLVEDLHTAKVFDIGQKLSTHPDFPEGANIGFMQIVSLEHLLLRVFERGCGETSACGSGAVAAAAIARLFHGFKENIKVTLPGGNLWIHWPGPGHDILLTGPASFVFEGSLMDV